MDGRVALRNNKTTDEHLKNVLLFMDYICSGDRIASCMNELYLEPVCQTGRDALVLPEGRDADNLATAGRCIAMVQDEQIIPKFQALLAGEISAQDMYDHIVEAAHDAFGAENCVSGKI